MDESSTITSKKNSNNSNNNSIKSQRIEGSIDKSHRKEAEILIQIPVVKKEEFVSLVSRLHKGHVSNYQNFEVVQALKHMVQTWMSLVEKPKSGIYSLPVHTCPKPNMIAKFVMLAEIAKIQPPFPKFTAKGLAYVVKLTFPISDGKTKTKFTDYLKSLSDIKPNESDGIEREYDLENFYKYMDRMKHMSNQQERDVLWDNHFGYKFNIKKNTINSKFEENVKLSSIHARIPISLKEQIHAILREKYSGKIRNVQSFELANAISNYVYYMNNEKEIEPTKSIWEDKKL